jgi:hypothetical protein
MDALRGWAEADVAELEAALGRLQGLTPEMRRTLLRQLGV